MKYDDLNVKVQFSFHKTGDYQEWDLWMYAPLVTAIQEWRQWWKAPARFGQHNKLTVKYWGAYSFSNYNCFIRAESVGRYCSIAPEVSIGMGEHDYTSLSSSIALEMNPGGEVCKVYRSDGGYCICRTD